MSERVENGSFEKIAGELPEAWTCTADPSGVERTISIVPGRDGGRAVRIDCTAYEWIEDGTGSSHADMMQQDGLALRAGMAYHVSLWARAEGIDEADSVRARVFDTSDWQLMGGQSLAVTRGWTQFEFDFIAPRDVVPAHCVFWLTLSEVGTLWLDDVSVSSGAPGMVFTELMPPGSSRNLIPNAGFELGEDRWTSLGLGTGWCGGLAHLHGRARTGDAVEGARALRIDLGPGITPGTLAGVPTPVSTLQTRPLAATRGWLEVQAGETHTLSAYLRADRPGVKARLSLVFGKPREWGIARDHSVELTTEWKRHSFSTVAETDAVFVALGPDLTDTPQSSATAWIDAVQLEVGEEATDFAPREAVEVGFDAGGFGTVFIGDSVELAVRVRNDSYDAVAMELSAQLEDYFGERHAMGGVTVEAPAGRTTQEVWSMPLPGTGHYAAVISWRANGRDHERILPLAAITPYADDDSPFGINHMSADPLPMRLLRQAGVTWQRDWSMSWQEIEPEPDQWHFDMPDQLIDRATDLKLHSLCLLPPFPSNDWSTSAPEQPEPYPWTRWAYAPEDTGPLTRFIGQTVTRYRGRIGTWEFLNEPVWTGHALPAAHYGLPGADYTVADYVELLKPAYRAMKAADPECTVVAGIGAWPDDWARRFIEADGLRYADAMNVHIYGGNSAPEGYIQPMSGIETLMRQRDQARPIWVTEAAYYAADRPPWRPFVPPESSWAGDRLLPSERMCADYSVRFAIIMLAHGAERLFYHSGMGLGAGVNDPAILESGLLDYGGEPRKLYAAQAALANVLGPDPAYAAELPPPADPTSGVHGYAFQCGARAVLAAWQREGGLGQWALEAGADAQIYDIMGNSRAERDVVLGPSVVYVVSSSDSASNLARLCRLRDARAK